MGRNRSTEIWHIPKRASIHQIVGSLNVLKHFKIDGKNWPSSRKLFDQKLAIWGFTSRGRSLSKNASETLEALLKYLGLLVIEDGKIRITSAGHQLINEHPLTEPLQQKRKLNETIKEMGNITSDVLKHQMMKLILTNPTVLQYCQNVLVSPFRETLILLLDKEIKYLTSEEMAMFLFQMHDKSERSDVKNKIINFRKLDEAEKRDIVDAFKETPEGNLTFVQAPTANYWKQLCRNTGLCEVILGNLYLKESAKTEAEKLLKFYEDRVYDFKSKRLWYEYYTVPSREQPIKIKICPDIKGYDEYLLTISNESGLITGGVIDKDLKIDIPAFPQEEHEINIIELQNGHSIYSSKQIFTEGNNSLNIDIDVDKSVYTEKPGTDFFVDKIKQLIQSKTFDFEYIKQLTIVSKHLNIDFLDKRMVATIRGGRLEYLFFKLLEILQEEGKISDLNWNGFVNKFGIARPAPGTQKGLPDITFKCDDTFYLLELTTIKSRSGQWTAEGSSVPFHMRNFDPTNTKKVVGLFAAPIIHETIDRSIKSALIPEKYTIISINISELVELLSMDDICIKLNEIIKTQYKDSFHEL
jgi:hypothetical protein